MSNDNDTEIRDMYLRLRGWTPHLAKPGYWWLHDIHKPMTADDAAKTQVRCDEAVMIYMLDSMSPAAKNVLYGHVMLAWTQQIGEFFADKEAVAGMKAEYAALFAKPEIRETVKSLVEALREIAK